MEGYVLIALKSIAVYVFIVAAIRVFGKKEFAQLSIIDLVFILLISNSVQNAMVGSNSSLLGGITAAVALFIINFIFKKIMLNSTFIKGLVQDKPIILIHNGTTPTLAEYGVIELGAARIPLTISTSISGDNVLVQATVTDAATTSAYVKVVSSLIGL